MLYIVWKSALTCAALCIAGPFSAFASPQRALEREIDDVNERAYLAIRANDADIHVTISLGLCLVGLEATDRPLTWEETVHLANQALYLAKRNGRNRAYGIVEKPDAAASELTLESDDARLRLLKVCDAQTS